MEAFSYHKDSIQAVKVNWLNKSEILTGGLDNIFNLIDAASGKNVFTQSYDETVGFVDWTNDGTLLIAGCLNNKIYIYQRDEEKISEKFVLEGPEDEFTSMSTHPKGNILLVSSIDCSIWMWNLNNGKELARFLGHLEPVNKALFTPNKKIASISDDCSLKIWKFGEHQPEVDISNKKRFHSGPVIDFSFHETKNVVVTVGQDQVYCISNYEKGNVYFKSAPLGELHNVEVASIFDCFQIGNLDGELQMIDFNKQVTLSKYKHSSGVIKSKFWQERKLFVTSTVTGDIIFNGSG